MYVCMCTTYLLYVCVRERESHRENFVLLLFSLYYRTNNTFVFYYYYFVWCNIYFYYS